MADLKRISDLTLKQELTGDETVLCFSSTDGTTRIPVEKISGASLEELASLPELTEAVGDETVIGVSNGSAVRIPVDAIGGGGVEPIILRAKSTTGSGISNVAYNDGSAVNIDDLKAAMFAGVPIYVGHSATSALTSEFRICRVVYIDSANNSVIYAGVNLNGTSSTAYGVYAAYLE